MNFLPEDHELLSLERRFRAEGFVLIAGVDEAGRGPLAGPVVAAAVCFPSGARVPEVNDSKQVDGRTRLAMRDAVLAVPGVRWAVGEVSASEIDRLNILRATDRAMREAVMNLGADMDLLLIDGRPVPYLPCPSLAFVGGDARSASIAAASILAKVYRDEWMTRADAEFPGYGFAEHKGYGTERHLEALRRLGPCALHRRSFAPVRALSASAEQGELF